MRPPMKLSEWLDEYRRFDPNSIVRQVAEPEDDWEDPGLYAPPDRFAGHEPSLARARSTRRLRTAHDPLVSAAGPRASGADRSTLEPCVTP